MLSIKTIVLTFATIAVYYALAVNYLASFLVA